jgi:transposase
LPTPAVAQPGRSRIRIELPSGVLLTVDASVDADALSRVIGVLAR